MLRFRSTRRRVLSPEEQAANAAKRAKRSAAAMTCQCCGRKILANTGVVAHHGFERPDFGWQTASCYGARRLPFEADRTALGELITIMKTRHASTVESIETTTAEAAPLHYRFSNYDLPFDGRGARPTSSVDISRATFAEARDAYPKTFRTCSLYAFDDVKENVLRSLDRTRANLATAIAESETRFGAWTRTHIWGRDSETWQPV